MKKVHSDPIRILLLDDSEEDAERLLDAVRQGGFAPTYQRVSTREAFRETLGSKTWDVVLGDHSLPGFDSIQALKAMTAFPPPPPFIAVVESIDQDTAVAVMKAGATDYVLRRNLARLVPAIRRELRDSKVRKEKDAVEAALRESEERFRCLSVSSPVGIFLAEANGEFVYVNRRCRGILGATMGQLIGRGWLNPILPEDREPVWQTFSAVAGTDNEYIREFRLLREDNSVVWVRFRSSPMRSDQGGLIGHVGTMEDITERRRAEQGLAMQYAATRVLGEAASWSEAAPQLIRVVCNTLGLLHAERWRIDPEANCARWKDAFFAADPRAETMEFTNGTQTIQRGEGLVGLAWKTGALQWVPNAQTAVDSPYLELARQESFRGIMALPVKQGDEPLEVLVFASGEPLDPEDNLLVVISALADQISQFLERQHLQNEFLQAQKMEVIGMLAGGVAHDFNNLLLVVMGYSDLMLQRLKPGDALYSDIEEIRKAGQRAATLTRQLLAFTRKGPGEQQLVDLNEVIGETLKMLRRVLGQSYELVTELDEDLGLVKADSGHIDQVLMNMAVNARDAMPTGGVLTISTKNITIDSGTNRHALPSGDYAVLSIADTGIGMTEDVKARIFEPFFTTKEKGKGTGLGLATCHSIVRKSGGAMEVESAPGKGTRFAIFLPRVEKPEVATTPATMSSNEVESRFAGRGERILIVDDEPALRDLTALVLTQAGYAVEQASNGREAVALLGAQPSSANLDLLLTDVDMPQMDGYELARRVAAIHPQVRIIFCSGYAPDKSAPATNPPTKRVFVAKPYTTQALVRTVRELLDRPS